MGNMLLDIFRKDAFNVVSLTEAINKLPYKPIRIQSMGLFEQKGIYTTAAAVEERDGKLGLVVSQARGTMPQVQTVGKRKVRMFVVPHLPLNENVYAEQVQGIREFGSGDTMRSIASEVNERLQSMKDFIDVTREWFLINSLQGNLLDGDGSTVIYNWFSEFGLSQTVINVDFTTFNAYNAPGAPTAADGGAGGNLSAGAYLYKVTFVTQSGETQGGTESGSVTLLASHKMSLTAIPLGPAGTLFRNLYRTVAGGASGSEHFLAQISDNTTTTYTDNIADASLGTKAVPIISTTSGSQYTASSAMDMKTVATSIIRSIEDALGVTLYRNIRVLCGNTFWDTFINHPTVIRAYERYQDREKNNSTGGSFLRDQQRQQLNRQGDDVPPGGFEFGGIYWENYRGHIGATKFIADKNAIAFPEGAPGVYEETFAPAPFAETVNTKGLPYYAKQEPLRFNTGIELHAQSNPLPLVKRPGVLISLVQVAP